MAEWQTRYVQVVVHPVGEGSTPSIGTIFTNGRQCGSLESIPGEAGKCGYSVAVTPQPSKLLTRVRLPLPAPRATAGGIPERPKGADCKSAVTDFDGSNPSPTTIYEKYRLLQLQRSFFVFVRENVRSCYGLLPGTVFMFWRFCTRW